MIQTQGLKLAHDSRYGLAGYIFTSDLIRAIRVSEALECGIIGVNNGSVSTPQAPFGGVKESGLGRKGGREGLNAFLETKSSALESKGVLE